MTAILGWVRASVLLMAAVAVLATPPAWAEPGEKADDVAKFLAGLEPSAGSALLPLTRDPAWRQHAKSLDVAWSKLERERLSKIRSWSAANLIDPKPAVLYMFSGPDFLYVDAFFPDRTTYVLSGLEPIGQIPTLARLPRGALAPALSGLRASVGTALNYSFFITQQMKSSLGASKLNGVLPVLYLFLARSGKTIHEVTLIGVDVDGNIVPAGTRDVAQAVKIVFSSGAEGRKQTLYYFQTDLSDGGLRRTGFLKFCERLGISDVFIKSASYLLHSDNFARLRGFLLEHTATLVQDDSGIPVRYFKANEWRLQPFGRYLGPIAVFPDRHQKGLAEVYRRSQPPRLDFGVGYRWRPQESNLLLAVRAPRGGVAQDTTGQR